MTRKICPTCAGKGKIPNTKKSQFEIPYNSEITCPNCQGEGFVGIADNLHKPTIIDKYKSWFSLEKPIVKNETSHNIS